MLLFQLRFSSEIRVLGLRTLEVSKHSYDHLARNVRFRTRHVYLQKNSGELWELVYAEGVNHWVTNSPKSPEPEKGNIIVANHAWSRRIEATTVRLSGETSICQLCVCVAVVTLTAKVLDCRCVDNLPRALTLCDQQKRSKSVTRRVTTIKGWTNLCHWPRTVARSELAHSVLQPNKQGYEIGNVRETQCQTPGSSAGHRASLQRTHAVLQAIESRREGHTERRLQIEWLCGW